MYAVKAVSLYSCRISLFMLTPKCKVQHQPLSKNTNGNSMELCRKTITVVAV